MSDILFNSPTIELDVDLKTEIRQYPVIPNPPGEATESLEKMGIDGVVYRAYDPSVPSFVRDIPTIPDEEGYYTVDLHKTANGYEFFWRRLAIPSNSLYPSDIQEV